MSSNLELLDFWTCLLLDSPTGDYTPPDNNSDVNYVYYDCRAYGKFLFQDSVPAYKGHSICVLIWLVTVIIGTFGIVTNIITVIVLRKCHNDSNIQYLLIVLAVLETVACMTGIVHNFMIVSLLGKSMRSRTVYESYRVSSIMFGLCRTSTIFLTLLVTIERYIVVAYPYSWKKWLTPLKSTVYILLVAGLTVILNITLIANPVVSAVESNDVFPPGTHAENFPYINKDMHFTNRTVHEFIVFVNYVLPFPLNLLFNALLFKALHDWKQKRIRVTGSANRRNEINVAKMFLVVVVVVLLCHTTSVTMFFISRLKQLVYRELVLIQVLCVVITSSTNFVIYAVFGKVFRKELYKLIRSLKK